MSGRVLMNYSWLVVVGLLLTASHAVAQDGVFVSTEEQFEQLQRFGFRDTLDLLEAAENAKALRLNGVDIIVVSRKVPGLSDFLPDVKEYFEVLPIQVVVAGGRAPISRRIAFPMSRTEVMRLEAEENTGMEASKLADLMELYGDASILVGAAVRQAILNPGVGTFESTKKRADNRVGYVKGQCTTPDPLTPQLSPFGSRIDKIDTSDEEKVKLAMMTLDPAEMMMGHACMLYIAAEVMRRVPDDDANPEQREYFDYFVEAIAQIEYDGVEDSNHVLSARGINKILEMDDEQSVVLNAMFVWINTDTLVREKLRMEGTREQGGETTPFFLEQILDDYRNVPGSDLWESFRELWRMGGVSFSDEKQAEMQQALVKIEELEQQMASMPAGQRAMMEKMMGPQIEKMRNLANGGVVEFEIITTKIEINPSSFGAKSKFTAADAHNNLIRQIQLYLTTLGYEPGTVDGELSKPTVVAIIKFETDSGMAATGEATRALATALSDAVRRND